MGSRSPLVPARSLDFTKGFMLEETEDGDCFVRTSVITTPVKLCGKGKTVDIVQIESNDETPIKNLPLKRPLMRDMSWGDETEKTKHSMEMRSRRCRNLKNEYYDRQEYSDYAEDLSFLFEDDLPELVCRPRRKPRKKRPTIDTKRPDYPNLPDSNLSSTSNEKNAKDESTSPEDVFCTTRPNMDEMRMEIRVLRKMTSFEAEMTPKIDFKSAKESENVEIESSWKSRPLKRRISASANIFSAKKRQKCEEQSAILESETKISGFDGKRPSKTLVISLEKSLGVERHLQLNRDAGKFSKTEKFANTNRKSMKSADLEKKETIMTRMTLRRRHSTPSQVGGTMLWTEHGSNMPRTISAPASEAGKEGKSQKMEGVDEWDDETYFDSEQFVDSPDSGFSSESSCSAVTPDAESVGSMNFNPTKCDESRSGVTSKQPASRTASKDSGIQLNLPVAVSPEVAAKNKPEAGELRLNLCQKSVLEAQRLEREAKWRQEEEMLREKFQCRWVGCPNPFENRCGSELHSHLEKYHAKNYCCKWAGCKFFEITSRKISFLQRHIGEHSGEKPYKCILDGCGASFSSTPSWRRHVEGHYSEVSLPKAKIGGDNGGLPRSLLNSRKIKDERKTLANRHDCMDGRTLSFIKNALLQHEVAMETEEDIPSGISEIAFQPQIVGERMKTNGKTSMLVHWKPENLLPDEWISEPEMKTEMKLKKARLPWNAKKSLKRLFFFRNEFGKKLSRKAPPLDSAF